MQFFLIFFLILPSALHAAPNDLCDIIKITNCAGVTRQLRRTTFPTAPSPTTAINLNPSNVSFDRGVGLDIMAHAQNPLFLSLTSGTGKMGGAFISGSLENAFFGNRIPELDESFEERYIEDQRFQNKKLSAAVGAKLFSNRKAGLDIGLIAKRHPEVKEINPGVGLSGRLWNFHFGASAYRDDFFIDLTKVRERNSGLPYSTLLGKNSLEENFLVTTYTFGARIGNFAVDVGTIKSNLDYYGEETSIKLYSMAYHHGNFLINMALRNEHSASPEFVENRLVAAKDKSDVFGSLQYSFNRHVVVGLNYNYFLLREMSLMASLFI